MSMRLEKEKIVPVLLKNKAMKVNEDLYSMLIDGVKCGIDFKKNEFFWMDDAVRVTNDRNNIELQKFKALCLEAMFPKGEPSNDAPEQPGQGDEGEQQEESTNEEKVPTAYQNNDTLPAAKPEEKPPQPSPAAGKKSTPLLDLIHRYTGNDVLEVFGDTGSGKSKFAMTVAREAIASGKKVFYLDTERNLTETDVKDLKGCEYKYTPIIEEIDKIVQNLPKVDVVVIDSIGFPVLTTFARMSVKQKGDALLKLIAIFGDLKGWAYRNNGIVVVTNQPESEFNKGPDHVLRPFGDKSQFAAKEIWKTEIVERKPAHTNIHISAFRSRSVGHKTKIASMKITSNGVEVV